MKIGSWVIIENLSKLAVCELFSESLVNKINTAKYTAIPAGEYLAGINRSIRTGKYNNNQPIPYTSKV